MGEKECFTFKMRGYEAISQSSPTPLIVVVYTPLCAPGLGWREHHQGLVVSWLPQLLNPSLGLFEALDTLIMGGRTRRAAPGALETGRKHPLWGRPDIPGHRQVHLLVPVPTSSPSLELLVPSSSRTLHLTSGVHSL